MTDNKLTYLGPLKLPDQDHKPALAELARKAPWGFLLVVALPTLIAAIYFLLIASPRYVAEARFIVRAPSQSRVSALGVALEGVGLSSGSTDAFAVHDYITSRTGLEALKARLDIAGMLGRPGVDAFSRYPSPIESRSEEGLYKGFQRFITVGYSSQTGISTLRVEAFRADDAQAIANALLDEGEDLVNRLNQRAAQNAVSDAATRRIAAQENLARTQSALAAFRNQAQFIDPARAAAESSTLIGGLLAKVAELNAERAQLSAEAPQSPQLSSLDNRIQAYQNQIATERDKIAGPSDSLAPRVGTYEYLVLQNEVADREFASSSASETAAQQDARRQKLYLERIVAPTVSDEPIEPRRWMSILSVLATCLLIYGVGWLIWAGVREHRQD